MSERLVFDIETDNLLRDCTTVHCIALYNLDTKHGKLYVGHEINDALERMSEASLLVGHNIRGFDIPALDKLMGWQVSPETVVFDTLLAGCILWPEEYRSLEDWTFILKLKQSKIQNEDWSVYTENMGARCLSDTEINAAVYNYITQNKHFDLIGDAVQLEGLISSIHAKQVLTQVGFDVEKALVYLRDLEGNIEAEHRTIMRSAPWTCNIFGVAQKWQEKEKKERTEVLKGTEYDKYPTMYEPFKKGGDYNANTIKYFGPGYTKVLGPYTKVEFKPFNPDSSAEVKAHLLSLGWEPTEWNIVKDKKTGEFRVTTPKLTEDSYDSLPPGLGQSIATYNTLKHRRNFLQNQKDEAKGAIPTAVANGGFVTADAFTCGTPTSRYRHAGTVCNIPRVTSIFGRELRSLFCVDSSSWQVGIDLSGIEARMLAHFLLRGNYKDADKTAALILSPDKGNDFHSYNAKVWGVSRDTAKTCLYALVR